MVFLMPTNSAAKSASLHTHFLWMDFTKRRTAASMTICTLHFMIHYKFISLTDSNLAFSPTMSATAGGGGSVLHVVKAKGYFSFLIYLISQGHLASWPVPPSWSLTFLLVLLPLATPSPFPLLASPHLPDQVLEHSDSVRGPLFSFCARSHFISSESNQLPWLQIPCSKTTTLKFLISNLDHLFQLYMQQHFLEVSQTKEHLKSIHFSLPSLPPSLYKQPPYVS